NRFNLDGCDSSCRYEVVTRLTSFAIAGTAAPAALSCTPATNRFGTQALTGTALGQLNPQLQTNINDAAVNVFMQFLGLDDLTAVADPNGFRMGIMDGNADPAKGTWPGNNPIDWWFVADHGTVNAMGIPTGQMDGVLAARALHGGPNDVTLSLLLG